MKRTSGVTLIELLVVMAIMGVVLSVLTAYFRQQLQVSSQVQAHNEVRTKLRSVAEIMTQDLQISGSRAVYDGVSVQYLNPVQTAEPDLPETDPDWLAWKAGQCSSQHRDGCVKVNTTVAGQEVALSLYYTTSLDRGGADACRRIDYVLDDEGMLYRRDVACGDTATAIDDYAFASGIDSITVSFICHDPDTEVADISSCYTAITYPREASVTVSGHAENSREEVSSSINLSTSLPNLRPPVDYMDLN